MKLLKFFPLVTVIVLIYNSAAFSYNNIKSKMQDGVYRSSVGTLPGLAQFSIRAPQADIRSEFIQMKTKEERFNDYTYLSFGPAAFDLTIYRAIVGVKDQLPFKVFKQKSIPMLAAIIQQAYKQPLTKRFEKELSFKGHPAIYTVFTQTIPEKVNLRLQRSAPQTLTHGIYFIDYGKYLVVLWTMGDSLSLKNKMDDSNISRMVNRVWQPELEFVNSFQIN